MERRYSLKIDPSELTHGERHRQMGDIYIPRPIAFVSTVSADGVFNLAPFSMSNIVSYHPAMVFFTAGRFYGRSRLGREDGSKKDTLANIEQTGDFVFNMVTEEIAEQMNVASDVYPPEVDEFEVSGLTPLPSDIVKAPRVMESPVNMECRLKHMLPIGEPGVTAEIIIGEVLRIHVRDDLWHGDTIDASSYHVIGRMGWGLYTRTRDLFTLEHPHEPTPP
jgi:flavin reductase (DIM6/NTAB) family NADH-FMN oxidoreductase RutF